MADSEVTPTSSARAKAEARRRRILESSGQRMIVASGGTEGDPGKSNADTPTSSASSRYAAARRRRKAAKLAVATPESGGGETKSDAAAAAAPEPAPEPEPKAKSGTEEEAVTATSEEPSSDNKKYLGVAKMRRKRLAEKKKREEEDSAATPVAALKGDIGPEPSTSVLVQQHRGAVWMQLVTISLLFIAGLSVGMKNSALNKDRALIMDGIVPFESGIGALSLFGLGDVPPTDAAKDARERLLVKENLEEKIQEGVDTEANKVATERAPNFEGLEDASTEDEFEALSGGADGDAKPKGAADGKKVPNIDPLFRVDLDELVAGDGFLNHAAAFAIKIHRFFLYAFLSLPASIVASIFALPRALFANPPMVFFLTVTIRMVGRNVLGARAPDVKAGEGGDDDGKDIFSMIKRTAIGYLSSSFPNAARLMEILKDARQDIFVTFCGLFVGLALPAHLGKELGRDEL